MGILILSLFPIKLCSAANLLTWTKFVGIQEMQKSFFTKIYIKKRLSSLGTAPVYLTAVSGLSRVWKCSPLSGCLSDCSGYNLASVEGPEIMEQRMVHLETILLCLQQNALPLSLTFRQITFQQQEEKVPIKTNSIS